MTPEERCSNCGKPWPCGCRAAKPVKVLSLKESHKCIHKLVRVYGIHGWRRLCLKCGRMTR